MAFPTDPSINEIYTDDATNQVFVWDGDKWTTIGNGGANFIQGATGATGADSIVPGPTGATGPVAAKIETGDTLAEVIDTGSDGRFVVTTDLSEKFRIPSSGAFGIAGANYGTTGQVLVSNGADASPSWTDANQTVFVSESVDDDAAYSLPFVSNTVSGSAQLGLTRDTGGITFNPFSNLFAVSKINSDQIRSELFYVDSLDLNDDVSGQGHLINSNTNFWAVDGINDQNDTISYNMTNNSRMTIDWTYTSDDNSTIYADRLIAYQSSGGQLIAHCVGLTPSTVTGTRQPFASNISDPDIGIYVFQDGGALNLGLGLYKKTAGFLSGSWRVVTTRYFL